MRCRADAFAGAEVVLKQRFRIVYAADLDGVGQTLMNLCDVLWRQLRDKGFANAIVIQLECVAVTGANKLSGSK